MLKRLMLSLLMIVALSSCVNAVGLLSTDLFNSDGSSLTDAKTFVNRPLTMEIYSSNIMVACFDYSNPNCDDPSIPAVDECFAANQQDFDKCKAYDSWLTGMGYTQDSGVSSQLMPVSSAITTCADAIYYKNCDGQGNGNKYSVTQKQYWVYSKRKFDCNSGSPTWYVYDAKGYISPSDYVYTSGISCPTYKKCSEEDDDSYVLTYNSAITNPCRTADGSNSNYACSQTSDCWSDNCGGSTTDYQYICGSNGGDSFQDQSRPWYNTCGGSGYNTGWLNPESTYYCSVTPGAGYVCDTAHDRQVGTWPSPLPSSPCKKNIDQSCSQTTDCWNDNGGNWCNSISKCTDGANGRGCSTGSDCSSGYCCSGTCSANSCEQVTDLAILEVIPIQVIPNVAMIKGKSGYVRVIVHNYGLLNATGQVNVTFDGSPLVPVNATKFVINGSNQTFDFIFKPEAAGNKIIIANVTIVN